MHLCEPIVFEFYNDRLSDLKLAMLESQLEDLYDSVSIEVHDDAVTQKVKVVLTFTDPDDQAHWILSQPGNHKLV